MLGRLLRWPPGFDAGVLPRAARDTPSHRAASSVITNPLIVVLSHGQRRRPPSGTGTRPPRWPAALCKAWPRIAPTRPCAHLSSGRGAERQRGACKTGGAHRPQTPNPLQLRWLRLAAAKPQASGPDTVRLGSSPADRASMESREVTGHRPGQKQCSQCLQGPGVQQQRAALPRQAQAHAEFRAAGSSKGG